MRHSDLRETETQFPEFDEWIDVATRGLCEEAAERVSAEILDHFLEARAEAARTRGNDEEATRTALAKLGDPRTAGRALRRQNLKRWEAGIVKGLEKSLSRWTLALYVSLVAAFLAVSIGHLDGTKQVLIFGLCLLSMVAGILGRLWFARLLARGGRLRSAAVTDTLGGWLVYAPLCVGSRYIVGSPERGVNAAVYGVILVGIVLLLVHLWPKLSERRA
jgi:hypothetical protein